eukprot:TRINITY_DN28611_c1_g1_i1.p1 TRINITY_DN28611_c1_g1~~TRINITY_DN28611_c1_g1_i1.p1  ORF type:complete len:531 (+),score=101.77 TRINITY_DN28611_c1_g1_i1:100-1593(+)
MPVVAVAPQMRHHRPVDAGGVAHATALTAEPRLPMLPYLTAATCMLALAAALMLLRLITRCRPRCRGVRVPHAASAGAGAASAASPLPPEQVAKRCGSGNRLSRSEITASPPAEELTVTVVSAPEAHAEVRSCRQRPTAPSVLQPRPDTEPASPVIATVSVTSAGGSSGLRRRIQAIFDIDDTIKSSGGHSAFGIALGGVDSQYYRGAMYPGVAQFALELSRHRLPPHERPAPVAVLTARPRELGPALKLHRGHAIVRAFGAVGDSNGCPGWGIGWDKDCVMYGSVAEWVRSDLRGWRKFDNFRTLLRCCAHPDVGGHERNQYVLVGDTGDRDMDCAEMMLREYPDDVAGCFMHVVSSKDNYEMPRDMTISGKQVMFFRTYPGAARKALAAGLMSASAMLRVCDEAQRDLAALLSGAAAAAPQDGGWPAGAQSPADDPLPSCTRWGDLVRDIELCRVMAQHGGALQGAEGGPRRLGGAALIPGSAASPVSPAALGGL